MNWTRKRGVNCGALLRTASFLALGTALTAQAQAQTQTAEGAPEQVLVTGSLIHGAAVVGVPVTALSAQDFHETGSLTTSDLLKEVPSLNVLPSNSATNPGATLTHPQTVAIHGISSGTATETLLMIDGMRFPVQGFGTCYVDPSIIPQLALERIDVLADGASATYGSDAVAGVINVILKHGFEGAISQLQYGRSTDIGGQSIQASQLYGTKWDTGDVTVSYEYYHVDPVHGPARPYFTLNFEPYGYNDATPIGSAMPGILSIGGTTTDPILSNLGFSANAGTRACTNCFSIPAGTGGNFAGGAAGLGPTVGRSAGPAWSAIVANPGVKNLQNPAQYADILPSQDRNAGTITFDQHLVRRDDARWIPGIELFVDGFYSNRRSVQTYIPGASPAREQTLRAVTVPTINPYYPSGTLCITNPSAALPAGNPAGCTPNNLRISYDLGVEHDSHINSGEIASRYAFGFNLELPRDWLGKVYYSHSYEGNYAHVSGMVNLNQVSAALGNTITVAAGTIPGQGAFTFTKPANIPYLNLFCDANVFTCNSPATMDYIGAYRNYDSHWDLGEGGINLDGPLFDLPGGTVRAALGAVLYSNHEFFIERSNFSTQSTSIPFIGPDPFSNNIYAGFAQVNVPLVGEGNKLPFIEALNVELGYRYDHYSTFGNVDTPKLAANWLIGEGFALRGSWGKAFRAPVPGESSAVLGVLVQPRNVLAGDTTNTILLNCPATAGHAAGTAVAGSLNAWINPTCSGSAALASPGGIIVSGGSGGAAAIRTSTIVGPEKSKNWTLGFTFDPMDFLKGLHAELTWYNLTIENALNGNGTGLQTYNDPAFTTCTVPTPGCNFIVRANPALPITDPANATFLALTQAVLANPRSTVNPANLSTIQFIQDNASINLGYNQFAGLDFNTRYDFDLGEWGAWNVGWAGTYQLINKTQGAPTSVASNLLTGNSGYQLKWRGRLGWEGTQGDFDGFSVTGFVNYYPHSAIINQSPPPCYWQTGFSAGSCYPGSPYTGPFDTFPNFAPSLYTFDLSLGYQTGTKPAWEYLQNINFQLTVNDLLNKAPPFGYRTTSGRGTAAFVTGDGAYINPMQRTISFTITKAW